MSKQNELQKIEQGWALLKASYDGLTDEQMVEPGVTGGWSVKDILAHVTGWELESLESLPVIVEDRPLSETEEEDIGTDEFNAQMTKRYRDLSVPQVLQQLEEKHDQLLRYLEQAPEEQFGEGSPFQDKMRSDTYEHYAEHAKAILEWRKIAPDHVASARDEKRTFDTDYPQNTEPV
ncbi:MAG: DinB family protein [Anaerolineaceae bacterium]